jgi:hypothetical protein
MSSQAQSRAANAIAQQNQATTAAQNQAFTQRMAAANAQTAAQSAAMQQTMADRSTAATSMRTAQLNAQQSQQDILAAENKQAEALRGTGDQAAQTLLQQTTGPQLAQGQQNAAAQGALLLGQAAPQGPAPTDPQGTGDTATQDAVKRRLAEAATNVRTYGSKVSALQSYSQPTADIGQAIAANQYGIMPAQAAESLLRSGSATRLLPSQVAYRNAGDLGQAMDQLIASRGQGALDTAGLSYGNAVSTANLAQSDADTIAANRAAQAKADAAYQQSLGGIVSSVGQLGLYGAGRYGTLPGFLKTDPAGTINLGQIT